MAARFARRKTKAKRFGNSHRAPRWQTSQRHCQSQALKNDRGRIVGAVNCLYDVTEQKKAEAELQDRKSGSI